MTIKIRMMMLTEIATIMMVTAKKMVWRRGIKEGGGGGGGGGAAVEEKKEKQEQRKVSMMMMYTRDRLLNHDSYVFKDLIREMVVYQTEVTNEQITSIWLIIQRNAKWKCHNFIYT